ncbi:MAG: M16 family metallopeptidase [Helicobacteraceae bacterium]
MSEVYYENKTPVIVETDASLPVVVVYLVLKNSGALSDKQGALSYLYARMLEEGSARWGKVKFYARLEENAIELSFKPSFETMTVAITCLKEKLDVALALLGSIITEPNFTAGGFERAQNMALSRLQERQADFNYLSRNGLFATLYDGNAGKALMGLEQDLNAIKPEDLSAKHARTFSKNNAIFAFGGDVSAQEALKYSRALLGLMSDEIAAPILAQRAKKADKMGVLKKQTTQSYISFGCGFEASDDEEYLCQVVSFVLSGGFGSRLMEAVRVKEGLAYSVWAKISQGKALKNFTGSLQTSLNTEQKAIDTLRQTLAAFSKGGAGAAELETTKNFYAGSMPLKEETMSKRLLRSLQAVYADKDPNDAKIVLEKIKALKLAELNAFIKNHSEINELNFFAVNAG